MMPDFIYVLHPGWVSGKFDGDRHYISAIRLAELYGVPIHKCVIGPGTDLDVRQWIEPVGAVHLRPRHDGNYVLPAAE